MFALFTEVFPPDCSVKEDFPDTKTGPPSQAGPEDAVCPGYRVSMLPAIATETGKTLVRGRYQARC